MKTQEADLIIHNAVIQTVDESFSIQEAMAIRGDSIVEIGPEHQILNKYTSKNIIDLNQKFVYPGLIDAHSHFKGYAESLGKVNLLGVKNADDLCKRALEFSKNNDGEWISGRGWDNTTWTDQRFPDKSSLDSTFPNHYVVLKRIDGHAALVNQKVLELAGIDANTQVEGGKIIVKDGLCTGILIDRAVDLVEDLMPEMDEQQLKNLLMQAEKNCFSVGLTSVCDAGLDKKYVDLLMDMQAKGDLSIKLYVMLNPNQENYGHYLKKGPIQNRDMSITSFKYYADGALGSRGAALIEPYSDAEEGDYHGLLLTEIDTLKKYSRILHKSGFQMNTHAIGDSANREMLKIYSKALSGVNDKRWRIEHAQVVNPADLKYFKEFSIIPSVQPTHCTSDMDWAIDRLGEEREKHAYAYKSLKDQNGMIAFGTDFPVENINPLYTLISAVRRTDLQGKPDDGFQMDESLDFESSLRAMTIWAALANFEENTKGSLENGKKADFIVVNRNLMELTSDNLEEYQIESTYLNGKVVHSFNE